MGLGVGVALGMVFAPKAGAETRSMIRERANEGGEYLRRRGTELRENASGIVDKGKDLVDRGKGLVDKQREQLGAALDAGRQAYRDTVGTDYPSSEGI